LGVKKGGKKCERQYFRRYAPGSVDHPGDIQRSPPIVDHSSSGQKHPPASEKIALKLCLAAAHLIQISCRGHHKYA
jgi:hypothetical protein